MCNRSHPIDLSESRQREKQRKTNFLADNSKSVMPSRKRWKLEADVLPESAGYVSAEWGRLVHNIGALQPVRIL